MRLLTVGNMYPPQHLGGYEAVWAASVEHLRAAGHEVTVLTTDTVLHPDAPADPPHVARTLGWAWRDHEFPEEPPAATLAREKHNAEVLARHLADEPDAVLWWSMGGMSLGLIAQVAKAGVPAGAVVHDGWPVYGPRVDPWVASDGGAGLRNRLRGLPSRFAPELIGAWSFNSAWLRDAVLERVGGIDPERCSVAHPGIDAAVFASLPAGEWAWRLACVGRVEETKGLAHAIDALAALPESATLTIAGGGDAGHRADLESQAEQLGLAGRVTFTGPVADVAAVYAAADAVLFPVTWEEPFGLVPLEAMAAGRPVVATGTGGSKEFLRDGVNSVLVPPGDADALAAAVRRLAEDAELRAALVADGLQTAAANPVQAFNRAMEEFARLVVSGGGRAGPSGR